MKFRLMSDLHLEFEEKVTDYTPILLQEDKETVLILAGDIGVGKSALPFIENMCKQFYKVVYILGNHEYYHNEVNKLRKQWAEYAEVDAPDNLIFLENDWRLIEDPYDTNAPKVRVVGGTLWTDFDSENWHAMNTAQHGMNDFHCVKIKEFDQRDGMKPTNYRKRKWLPADAVRAHKETLFTITETVRVPHDGPTLVVTHHLPHPLCVGKAFQNHPLNASYVTNLDMYIEEYDIDAWVHGHTHNNVDVEVHGTRIMCNPRGYVDYELNPEYNEKFTFDL